MQEIVGILIPQKCNQTIPKMQNSSGSKTRRKTVRYRRGLSWSEDTQTRWQTVFGSNWTKAAGRAPWEDGGGPRTICTGILEISLGSDSFQSTRQREGAPYIAKTYLSSYRQNDVMSRICFQITCKVRLKVKRDKMKGTQPRINS